MCCRMEDVAVVISWFLVCSLLVVFLCGLNCECLWRDVMVQSSHVGGRGFDSQLSHLHIMTIDKLSTRLVRAPGL